LAFLPKAAIVFSFQTLGFGTQDPKRFFPLLGLLETLSRLEKLASLLQELAGTMELPELDAGFRSQIVGSSLLQLRHGLPMITLLGQELTGLQMVSASLVVLNGIIRPTQLFGQAGGLVESSRPGIHLDSQLQAPLAIVDIAGANVVSQEPR
jgi:hypothetical protein